MMFKYATTDYCYASEGNLLRVIDHYRSKYRAKFIPYGKKVEVKGLTVAVSYKKNKSGEYIVFVNKYTPKEAMMDD